MRPHERVLSSRQRRRRASNVNKKITARRRRAQTTDKKLRARELAARLRARARLLMQICDINRKYSCEKPPKRRRLSARAPKLLLANVRNKRAHYFALKTARLHTRVCAHNFRLAKKRRQLTNVCSRQLER